jgi:hypothetical protein
MIEKGIKVDLNKPFPIVRETLSRIGIANREEKKLFPSCYIYQKGEDYFISHFKELLKNPDMDEVDYQRRDTIIWLLENWELISICCDSEAEEIKNNILKKKLFVLSKDQMEREDWLICHKLHQYGITQYSSID